MMRLSWQPHEDNGISAVSDLRWILLIFGVLIILAIYFYDRFNKQIKHSLGRKRKSIHSDEAMPHFGDETGTKEVLIDDSLTSVAETTVTDEPERAEHYDLELADLTDLIREAVNESKEPFLNSSADSSSEPEKPNKSESNISASSLVNGNIVVINLLPRERETLTGPDLLEAFANCHIVFGDMKIFHYSENGQRLFSIANLVEPGTFDPESMLGFSTKGVSLFMQLKDLIKPAASFERMLEIVWELANELHADICDIKCEVMTPQTATRLLDAVKHYEAKIY